MRLWPLDGMKRRTQGKRRPTVGNAGGAAWLETLAEEETGERSGERALSRLIQRDARRYDGGFSLY